MNPAELTRLIQWLRAASTTTFDFTYEGRQEVCKPKYMLTRDRDMIIKLLEDELKRQLADISQEA